MADDDALRALLMSRDGVLTRTDALGCGLSSSAIARRVDSGAWRVAARGVYVVADRPSTDDRVRTRVAVCAVGTRAVLAGAAAAWWHGLVPRPPARPTVMAPRGRHAAEVSGVRVWHRDTSDVDVTTVAGLRVTAVPLTVLDAAVESGVVVMDSALLRERVSIPELIGAQRRNRGRRGSPRSRAMLAAMSEGARSEAERRAVGMLRTAGVRGWRTNHPACGYVLDLAFPEEKVSVEIDGLAFHSDAEAFQRDRQRHNTLIANGWTVLHITWHDITEHPQRTLAHIAHTRRRATVA